MRGLLRQLAAVRDALNTSCLSGSIDTARTTTSFIRKGTLPTIAGNPPANSAQPFGMNGMIVTVVMKVTVEPRVPRIPNFLFQNPENKSAAMSHSDAPKKRVAPQRTPKAGYRICAKLHLAASLPRIDGEAIVNRRDWNFVS